MTSISAFCVEKGFHIASGDLNPKQRFVVYPGEEQFPLGSETEAIGLSTIEAQFDQLPDEPRIHALFNSIDQIWAINSDGNGLCRDQYVAGN